MTGTGSIRHLAALTALALAAPAAAEWEALIPAAAHAAGVSSTFFETDVSLGNPAIEATAATLFFLPRGQDNSALDHRVEVSVPARGNLFLEDIVAGSFGLESGAGAILVRAERPLVVRSRTANRRLVGEAEAAWGQELDGIPLEDAIGENEVAHILGLRGGETCRSNLGFASASAAITTVAIRLRGSGEQILADGLREIPPFGSIQFNDVFASFGLPTSTDPIRAEVQALSAGAALVAYGSTVDAATGDPTTLFARSIADARIDLLVPTSAHAAGAFGSLFVTDLLLWNPAAEANVVEVIFLGTGGEPLRKQFTLQSFELREITDVVGAGLFDLDSGFGPIRLLASLPLLAQARIYNANAIGPDGQAGTAGQSMATLEQGLEVGGAAYVLGISGTGAERSNVGFVNRATTPVTLALELWDGGDVVATGSVAVAAEGYVQLNDVVGKLGAESLASGQLVARVAAGRTVSTGGSVLIYGSLISNVGGDPTTLDAGLLAPLDTLCVATPPKGQAPLSTALSVQDPGAWGELAGSWSFGDGTPGSAELVVDHSYSQVGAYVATWSGKDQAGRTATCGVSIDALPAITVNCMASPPAGEAPLDVTFGGSASGGLEPYESSWSFGDGTTGPGPNAYHTYTAAGAFQPQLKMISADGRVGTCTTAVGVRECALPDIRGFAASDTSLCPGESSTLSWSVENAVTVLIDPTIGAVPAIGATVVSPAFTTTYTLSAINDCGEIERALTVNVGTNPSLSPLSISPNPIAFGGTAGITFTVGNGATVSMSSALGNHFSPKNFGMIDGTPTVTYFADTASGADTITVAVTNACGTTSRSAGLTVNP